MLVLGNSAVSVRGSSGIPFVGFKSEGFRVPRSLGVPVFGAEGSTRLSCLRFQSFMVS